MIGTFKATKDNTVFSIPNTGTYSLFQHIYKTWNDSLTAPRMVLDPYYRSCRRKILSECCYFFLVSSQSVAGITTGTTDNEKVTQFLDTCLSPPWSSEDAPHSCRVAAWGRWPKTQQSVVWPKTQKFAQISTVMIRKLRSNYLFDTAICDFQHF